MSPLRISSDFDQTPPTWYYCQPIRRKLPALISMFLLMVPLQGPVGQHVKAYHTLWSMDIVLIDIEGEPIEYLTLTAQPFEWKSMDIHVS